MRLDAKLANCRLVVIAIVGSLIQDGLTGNVLCDWALRTVALVRTSVSGLGVQIPMGSLDPAGFTQDGDAVCIERHTTEIKHGCISKLVAIGYFTPEIIDKLCCHSPPSTGLRSSEPPTGLAVTSGEPVAGWAQFITCIAGFVIMQNREPRNPGAEGIECLEVLSSDGPAVPTKKLNAEMAKGRLAAMAIIGVILQDGLAGNACGDVSPHTASLLGASECELDMQAPTGPWDPVGLTQDGDAAAVRRRAAVIKHGRVSVLAAMGQSPDVQNGSSALFKVPDADWSQITSHRAFCEGLQNKEPGTQGAECNYGFKMLTSHDPAVLAKKSNAEISIVRLDMITIISIIF